MGIWNRNSKGRHVVIAASVALAATAVVAFAAMRQPSATDDEARNASARFIATLGLEPDKAKFTVTDIHKRRRSTKSVTRWIVTARTTSGHQYTLLVHDGTPPEVGLLDNTARAWDRARGKGRTDARAFADADAAKAHLITVANRLKGDHEMFLDEFRFTQNSASQPGKVFARFLGTVNGHPFVDRFHGVLMELDSQDGEFVSLRQSWRLPTIGSSKHTLSLADAKAAYRRSNPKGSETALANVRSRLGYAVVKGTTEARLVWVLKFPEHREHLDACTGERVSVINGNLSR